MSLRDKIDNLRREIAASSVSMSIGELENLYLEDDLDIHPDFQRLYRWDRSQKSRLVESVLLGIPIPSFFVSSDEQGRWEVVDGLQRISTFFEFLGVLKDETGTVIRELELEPTKNVPELKGVKFSAMDKTLQREFKRSRIDIKVLNRGSDEAAKYDLFERLNTYGSSLTSQEVRNCILVSKSGQAYEWLKNLAHDESFANCIALSDKQVLESYDMELAMRFLYLRKVDFAKPLGFTVLQEALKDYTDELASKDFPFATEEALFREVFSYFNSHPDGSPFRAYRNKKHKGGFSLAAFEGLALSVGFYWNAIREHTAALDLSALVSDLWRTPAYEGSFSGKSTESRMIEVIPVGRKVVLKHIRKAGLA